MRSYEVLKAAVAQRGAKEVSTDLKVSLSMLYKWMEPANGSRNSGSPNPLDRVAEICRLTGDKGPVHWLCRQMAGFYVPNPSPQPLKTDGVLRETQAVLKHFSSMLDAVSTGFEDDKLTGEEAQTIRAHWEELKATTESFVTVCEATATRSVGATS